MGSKMATAFLLDVFSFYSEAPLVLGGVLNIGVFKKSCKLMAAFVVTMSKSFVIRCL